MRLPTPLLRRKSNVHKNQFGHVLILAGSKQMLGAGALTSLAAIRSGAGLVTLGIPQSLNTAVQKKISNVVMTLPLKETRSQTLAFLAFTQIKNSYSKYTSIALGPGLSENPSTQRLILRIIEVTLECQPTSYQHRIGQSMRTGRGGRADNPVADTGSLSDLRLAAGERTHTANRIRGEAAIVFHYV